MIINGFGRLPETCPLYPQVHVDFVDNLYTAIKYMTRLVVPLHFIKRKCVDEQISLCYIKVTMERSFFYAHFSEKGIAGQGKTAENENWRWKLCALG